MFQCSCSIPTTRAQLTPSHVPEHTNAPVKTPSVSPIGTASTRAHNAARSPIVAKPSLIPVSLPEQKRAPSRYSQHTSHGVTFSIVSFDTRSQHLKIADQLPGVEWTSARQACHDLRGVAAINGGFFDPKGLPLGKVISATETSGSWNSSSSLTSGIYHYDGQRSSLKRAKHSSRTAEELIQTGPFLVENNKIITGLNSSRIAQRSLLLWNGSHHFGIATTSATSLSSLAKAVQNLPSSLPRKYALNLDGGRSCDLYVSAQLNGTAVTKSHWIKNQVRNYLVIVDNED